jgi:uncharacterized membrane protein YbhN (UPF0104 family)
MPKKKVKDTQTFKYVQAHSAIFLTCLGLLLVLYIFVPQLGNLKEGIAAIKSANPAYVIAATLVFCLGFPILAWKYIKIGQIPLIYWLTLKVQFAGAFISKLLPQSVGSLTVNTYYLTAAGHTITQSASVMALNALTSSIGFGLIIIAAIIFGGSSMLGNIQHKDHNTLVIIGILIAVSIILWFVVHMRFFKQKVSGFIASLWDNFKTYKEQPSKVLWGIVSNAAGSMTGITALYLCGHAVGLPITLPQVVLSYAFGSIAGNLVPTPGGLGGAEAGLYAGFVLAGYDESASFAAVMIYRMITYWMPIIPGYLFFRNLRKTTFAGFHIRSSESLGKGRTA